MKGDRIVFIFFLSIVACDAMALDYFISSPTWFWFLSYLLSLDISKSQYLIQEKNIFVFENSSQVQISFKYRTCLSTSQVYARQWRLGIILDSPNYPVKVEISASNQKSAPILQIQGKELINYGKLKALVLPTEDVPLACRTIASFMSNSTEFVPISTKFSE